MPETPKAIDPAFERTQFQLVLGMHELFHAAHRIAESQDCLAFCDNSTDDWPVEKAADSLLAQLQELRATNPRQPVALIADGELSSSVTGDWARRPQLRLCSGMRGKNCREWNRRAKRWNRRNRRKQSGGRRRSRRRNFVSRLATAT